MRRKDREVTDLDDILAILDKCEVMRLGLCADGRPYVVPMNFAYEAADGEVSVYFHCAPQGRKLEMLRKNSRVCFEADCSYKTLRAGDACEWSAEFESVIGEGEIAVLEDEAQKIKALDALMLRYGFSGKPQYSPKALSAVTILCVRARSITGKRRLRPPGEGGAR